MRQGMKREDVVRLRELLSYHAIGICHMVIKEIAGD